MITMRRQLLGLGFVAASSLFALNAANAMSGPSAITIDGGPFGSLNLSGGVDGYGYGIAPSATGQSNNGAYIANSLVELQKTTGELQFTIEIGSNGGAVTLGTQPAQTSITTFSTGPLYAGYLTLAPKSIPGLTISAGQIGSLEGWESGVDWNNSNQLTTDIFYVQNSQSRGVEVAYTTGPFSGTVAFGDGYDNGVWNYVQFLGTYTINSTNAASVYGGVNLGVTGPFARSYADDSPTYANSDLYGAFYNYTLGSLNLVPEIQYSYTRAIARIGLSKPATNLGAALFADYSFGTSPYSVGAWGEYFNTNSSSADGAAGVTFLGLGAKGFGVSVSPTWQYKYLFARADLGGLWVTSYNKSDGNLAFGDHNARGVFTGLLEAGLLF
jgi:hypothetical protein